MSGAGVTLLSDIAGGQGNSKNINNYDTASGSEFVRPQVSDSKVNETSNLLQDKVPSEFSTMRPIRKKQDIMVTVGQTEGDLQGKDDKVLQAAVDYVSNLGGGTVHILPGVYTMRNSLFPRPGITIRGSGDKTILRKSPSVSSKIVREADWFEYCVKVEDRSWRWPRGSGAGRRRRSAPAP